MGNINKRVFYLFNLHYKKQATPQQIDELFSMLKDLDDEQLTQLMQNTWDDVDIDDTIFSRSQSQSILSNILSDQHDVDKVLDIKTNTFWGWKKIAAVVIITLSVGFFFIKKAAHPVKQNVTKNQLIHDALPGDNKAILTLGNGVHVVLDNTHSGVIARQGNTIITKNKIGQVGYKKTNQGIADAVVFNTITTPKGGQYQVVLPDGSKVWLNAASSIKFPTQFTGAERHVEIIGEAYFEVAKNAAMPFIVKAEREEVRVLGTHFSIMAYADEKVLKTTLLEGSIMLTSAKSVHVLKPGNQAVLNKQGEVKIIQDADVEEAVAWKNGMFQFKDEDIESIMRQAARWYDVEVSYSGKIPVKELTGKISRNVKLSELLNMLKYAGLNFTIEGKKITVTN